mgnify:CR=1 FL=1
MRAALGLAARGLGQVWPNPAVGCILAQGDRVVGRGWTQPSGRPHAETQALARAGAQAKGATAYVTLEPCAHHGRTPPCAEALIEAGIARAVVALEDPDPRVEGRGLALLREAGIAVDLGIEEKAAAALNAGFLCRLRRGRPLVTLKLASSLDGRIAAPDGESQWITGDAARARAHLLRAEADAVMIGANTAVQDDPELSCRLPGMGGRQPVRIVLDGSLRLPLTSRLVRTARKRPLWVIARNDVEAERARAFADCGVEVIGVTTAPSGLPDIAEILEKLGERGLTRLLVEGGSRLAASLVRAGLVDRIAWFRAPSIIGGDGLPAIEGFGLEGLSAAPSYRSTGRMSLGHDLLETFARDD